MIDMNHLSQLSNQVKGEVSFRIYIYIYPPKAAAATNYIFDDRVMGIVTYHCVPESN